MDGDDHVWTAAELQALDPAERSRVVAEGFIFDESLIEPELLARARAHGRALAERRRRVLEDDTG